MGLVHHTDAQRECADDRAAPHVVALDRPSLSREHAAGWLPT
jgi:hypothetical protein